MIRNKFNLILALSLLMLVFSSCSQTNKPQLENNKIIELARLNPQAPAINFGQSTSSKKLVDLGPRKLADDLSSLATSSGRIEMKILVISAKADDPDLNAAKSILGDVGIPYDVLIATSETLTSAKLANSNGDGNYYGIILADSGLSFNNNGNFESAFSSDEWNLLYQYERDYKVRQLTMYTYPHPAEATWNPYPEDYGIRQVGAKDTTNADYPAYFTSAGNNFFSSIKNNTNIPIRYAYTYLAKLDTSKGVNATPLLKDASGNVLAVNSTSTDGRERIALTFAHNPYVIHTKVLSYDLVKWLTKGIHLGDKQFYFGLDQDDWFLPSDKWDANTGGINGTYLLSAHDAKNAADQQDLLKNRYDFVRNSPYPFAYTMAYNASGSNPRARYSCSENVQSVDPLSSITKCLQPEFFWVNHTWSHEYMDWTDFWESYKQVYWNQYASYFWFGFHRHGRADYSTLVTGDVSGLGWFNPAGPDDPGLKQDLGLERSNKDFLKAARYRGIRYMASNMSVKSHEPDCSGCGIYHPLEKSILLVPRWPTNVFYSVTTPWDAMDAYNKIYGPNGTQPFFDHDLSYNEFLDFEANIAFAHLLSGQPYPHYQHIGNLRDYGNGKSLAYDWTKAIFDKYERYYNLPLLSLSWRNLGRRIAYRTSFMNSGVKAVWDRNNNTIRISTSKRSWVYLSGLHVGRRSWTYGDMPISRFRVSSSFTIDYNPSIVSQAASDQGFEIFDAEDDITTLANEYGFDIDLDQEVIPESENR